MRRHRSAIVLGATLLMVAAAGCSVMRPGLDRHEFALQAERPGAPAASNPGPRNATLKVGRIGLQPPYGGTSFVYRVGELRYELDPYNGFVAAPNELLGHQIAEWLRRSGLFAAVREPASPLTGDYVLEGLVLDMHGDIRDADKPTAVLAMEIYVRRASADRTLVFDRTYAQRVAIDNGSPDALAQGLGVALTRILEALERDLAALKPGG